MFKKGDMVRMIGDEDKELFVVLEVSILTISGYTVHGGAKYSRNNTKMLVKPINNPRFPGTNLLIPKLIILKSKCEHFMTKKEVKPYSFLN
jgi:hypothetical protein